MKRFVLLLGVLLVMASCNQKQSVNPDKLVYLTDDNIPPLQTISFEQVDLPEDECMNSYFYVYDDSILIIDPLQPQTYCLTVMNINTKEIIGRYLPKGRGPGEVLYCAFQLCQNRLLGYEGTGKLIIFNMDSLLLTGQAYKPAFYRTGLDIIIGADVLTDTSFLFSNIWYMDGCGSKVNEALPELLVAGKDRQISFDVPKGAIAVSGNETNLLSNPNLRRVFITYTYKPQFTLLNSNLDTLKIIYGPDPLLKPQKFREIGGCLYPAAYSEYAINAMSTNSNIFVSSSRIQNIPPKEFREVSRKTQDEIYQFDWDGNMVARYQMEKTHYFIGVCGYSEKSRIMYAVAEDENGERALFKTKL